MIGRDLMCTVNATSYCYKHFNIKNHMLMLIVQNKVIVIVGQKESLLINVVQGSDYVVSICNIYL